MPGIEVMHRAYEIIRSSPCIAGIDVARALGQTFYHSCAVLAELESRGFIRPNPGNLGGWLADEECEEFDASALTSEEKT